jgi:hypothetical protein
MADFRTIREHGRLLRFATTGPDIGLPFLACSANRVNLFIGEVQCDVNR